LAELSEFSHDAMEQALRSLAETMGIKAGQVFMPLRVAITGRTATPGIFETMDALGKERVLKRLDQAITVLN
jgi:glutamyl-tRNA synthetase